MYGPYLALGTALCWTFSAVAFEEASRRVGSVPVNILRLLVAMLLLMAFNAARLGQPIPTGATADQWGLMLASGVLGFFVGDLALFRAYVLLGARLSSLLMCLAPPVAAVTELLFLDGWISLRQVLGMFVTLAGVAWVIYERPAGKRVVTPADTEAPTTDLAAPLPAARQPWRVTPFAVFLGVTAAVGQGVGIVFTKAGMSRPPELDPFAASQMRIVAGIVTFAGLVLVTGRVGDCVRATRNGKAMLLLLVGAITGPLLGVSMLNKAVSLIPSGVAQTITSLVPVLIIPLSVRLQKEQVSWKALLGAIAAVGGVGMLVL
jgi:drug/metabolite transporter (DMT)-like permease